jgi:hypothetical protein
VVLPKVLIFTAIYDKKDYALPQFLEHAQKISYPNKRHILIDNSKGTGYYKKLQKRLEGTGIEVVHVQRGHTTRESLARAQQYARKLAIEENYDYMFSLESDIYPQEDSIIQDLMYTNKEVVSGLYLIGDREKNLFIPCATLLEFNEDIGMYGTRLLTMDEVPEFMSGGQLRQVGAAGFGCCLISRKVFTKIPFMYEPHFTGHSDIWFFNECFRNQIPVFVHTGVKCNHNLSDWKKVEDR